MFIPIQECKFEPFEQTNLLIVIINMNIILNINDKNNKILE